VTTEARGYWQIMLTFTEMLLNWWLFTVEETQVPWKLVAVDMVSSKEVVCGERERCPVHHVHRKGYKRVKDPLWPPDSERGSKSCDHTSKPWSVHGQTVHGFDDFGKRGLVWLRVIKVRRLHFLSVTATLAV